MTEMNAVRRLWWIALMDRRGMVRHLAARLPKVTPSAVRLRSVVHLIAGNPATTVAAWWSFTRWVDGSPWFLALLPVAYVAVVVEVLTQVALARPGLLPGYVAWAVGWREWWRLRRRWPWVWEEAAVKTARVQAEVGTNAEPVAAASLRPIADHPKLSWWPEISWPVVTCWTGPPPGRSFPRFDPIVEVLAASIGRVHDVELEWERPTDSAARLTFVFADPLADGTDQTWPDDLEVDPGPVPWSSTTDTGDDLADVLRFPEAS